MSNNSDDCELTPYSEMAQIISNLAFLVREKRRARRLSMRQVAIEIGINASTIHRLEHGKEVSTANLVSILAWLDWTYVNLEQPIPAPPDTPEYPPDE